MKNNTKYEIMGLLVICCIFLLIVFVVKPSKDSLVTSETRNIEAVANTLNKRNLLETSPRNASNISMVFNGEASPYKSFFDKSLGKRDGLSAGSLSGGYGAQGFTMRNNHVYIAFVPWQSGYSDAYTRRKDKKGDYEKDKAGHYIYDKTQKVGFYEITIKDGKFDANSQAYHWKPDYDHFHFNDMSYNAGTKQYVVVTGDGDDRKYRVRGDINNIMASYPLRLKDKDGNLLYYNKISVINDRFDSSGEAPKDVSGYHRDGRSLYVAGLDGPGRVFVAKSDNNNAIYKLSTAEWDDFPNSTSQSYEYHDGYLYHVVITESVGHILVYNLKLNKAGRKTMVYTNTTPKKEISRFIVDLQVNLLNKKIMPDFKTKNELEGVSFVNDTDNNMYLLTSARYEGKGTPNKRYPVIYKLGLTSINGSKGYFYSTKVNYYDDNTSPNVEKYYYKDHIDNDYYNKSSDKSYLGWLYSRSGGGQPTITSTFMNKGVAFPETLAANSALSTNVNLYTVKLISSKYNGIGMASSVTVKESTIEAFLSTLTCKRCSVSVTENGVVKNKGNFIAGKTYKLIVTANDTAKSNIRTVTLNR